MDPTDLTSYADAIKRIESSGGNYGLTGPATRNGDRAYGAYQVMGNNIPSWTQKHFGTALTPQQFLQNKEAQDAVFNGEFGSYVQKHGNPQDAASMWFTGRPLAQGGRSSDGYITGNQYVDKFNKYLGGGGGNGVTAINQAMGVVPGVGNQAMAFSGDDGEGGSGAAPANPPGSGTLSFGGNNDGSGKRDNRYGLGDLFGASDETKDKMHGIGARLVRAAAALSAGVNPGQSSQLNALGKSLEDNNKTDYQYTMGPNGQLVKINKDTGEVSFATLPGGGKGSFGIVMGKDAQGNPTPIGKINHSTGDYSPYGGQQAQPTNGPFGVPVSETNPMGLPDNLDDLKSAGKAGQSLASQIEGVHRGDIAYPAGGSRMTPDQRQLKAALGLYFPDMNSNDFNARKKFRETIANTAGNSRGAQYASLNHSYDLLAQSADNVERLGNSDNFLPVGVQQLYNSGKNQQNSSDRSGAAKNIDTSLIPALMGEQGKLYYGTTGGGQEERKQISKSLVSNDTLTNQVEGLKTIRDQLTARQAVLEGEADKAYGKGAEAYYPINDAGRKSLEKLNATIARLEDKQAGLKSAAPAAKPPSIPSSWEDAQKAGWK